MALAPCLRVVALLFLPVLMVTTIGASGTFRVSPDFKKAYDLVLNLQLEEASREITLLESRQQDNMLVYYLADYIDFLKISIRDDRELYQETKTDRDMRLRIISLGDVSSPYYLFTQAEIYLHRALLRMRFGEHFYAATDLNQAFKLLKRNQKRFPDFAPNLKTLGILKAAFGTIPDSYKWAVELLSSLEGSVEEGMHDLQRALRDKDQFTYRETQYLYVLALMHFENDPDKAMGYARASAIFPDENVLQCFLLSHVALKSGRNDQAIEWLSATLKHEDPKKLPHLLLMYGTAKLHRLDADADVPLRQFLEIYPGNNYRKEALQKLAWHALLQDDTQGYHSNLSMCKKAGCATLESDQYAQREAERNNAPHPALLKVRLLFDGGYDFKALEALESISFDDLAHAEEVEYRYRSGRVYQRIGREYDALFAYKSAISSGSGSTAYHACAAALQAGLLYEGKEDHPLAEQYFQICLGLHPEEYASGLHAKAKAGLSRIRAH